MKQTIHRTKKYIEGKAGHPYFGFLLCFLAAADLFLLIVPTDGLLVAAVFLNRRRWLSLAILTGIGSAVGSAILAMVIESKGLPFFLSHFPQLEASDSWKITQHFMQAWGSWAIFAIAISPMMQHPAVALGGLAKIPVSEIFFFVLLGRVLKYLVIAYVIAYLPNLWTSLQKKFTGKSTPV